jgi:hypothetical protein
MKPIVSSNLDRLADCHSYDELIDILVDCGLSKQDAATLVDNSFRIHKLLSSTYSGSYV